MRFFLVDDDPSLRRLFVELLKEKGHTVASASSGAEALKLLEGQSPPDLLLVDSSMPVMSGEQFLKKLKTQSPTVYESSFIIGFTAFQKGCQVIEEFEREVDELVEKPQDIDGFLALVDALPSRMA